MFFTLLCAGNCAVQWLKFDRITPITFSESEMMDKVGFVLFKRNVGPIEGTIEKGLSTTSIYGASLYALSVKGGKTSITKAIDGEEEYVKFTVKNDLCPSEQAIGYTLGTTTKGSSGNHFAECFVGVGANKVKLTLASNEQAQITQNGQTKTITNSQSLSISEDAPYVITIVSATGSISSSFETSGSISPKGYSGCLKEYVMQFSTTVPKGKDYSSGSKIKTDCTLTNPKKEEKSGPNVVVIVVVIMIVLFIVIIVAAVCWKLKHPNEQFDSTISESLVSNEDQVVPYNPPPPPQPKSTWGMNFGFGGANVNVTVPKVEIEANLDTHEVHTTNMNMNMGIPSVTANVDLNGSTNMNVNMGVPTMNMNVDMNAAIPTMNMNVDMTTNHSGMTVNAGMPRMDMNMDMSNMMNMPGAKFEGHYTKTENGRVVESGHFHN